MSVKKSSLLLIIILSVVLVGCDKTSSKITSSNNKNPLVTNFIHQKEADTIHYYFKKKQSYELADLIKLLLPDKDDNNIVIFLQNLDKRELNLYWLREADIEKDEYSYLHKARAGLLINGIGQTNYWQEWQDGLLVNKSEEVGLYTLMYVRCEPYWKSLFIEIITAQPMTIDKILSATSKGMADELRFHRKGHEFLESYFIKHGLKLEKVENPKGLFAIYKVTSTTTKTVWLVVQTSQGTSAGNTNIYIYYDYPSGNYALDLLLKKMSR